jgi:hypothetical protein
VFLLKRGRNPRAKAKNTDLNQTEMLIGDLPGNDCVDLFLESAPCALLLALHRSDLPCLRSYLSTTSFSSDIREHFEIGERRLAGP